MSDLEQDDDVQVLGESSKSIKCAICGKNFQNLTAEQRQKHYDSFHAEQVDSTPSITAETRNLSLKPLSAPKRKRNDRDTFWHPSEATDPPTNFTPGLIPLLKKALIRAHEKGYVQKAYLCCPRAVHVAIEGWDRKWGCGYRNFEMACVPLMEDPRQPTYFSLLDSPLPPSVEGLQQWLESAWKAGYDPEGATFFKNKLEGTNKWIGTADIYAAMTSRGIPANLVDFDCSKGGSSPLIKWIMEYFTQDPPKQATVNDALRSASPIVVTERLPIILQHDGHSRTVVGYERLDKGSINLFMFDPSKTPSSSLRSLALSVHIESAGSVSPPSADRKHRLSPKRLIDHVLYRNGNTHAGPPPKRPRSEEPEVIIIDDNDGDASRDTTAQKRQNNAVIQPNENDLTSLLRWVRSPTKDLNKKKKYQILYFPMTDPLTEEERLLRREVTSLKMTN